jgi:muramoyltetrapeptide carboxypeptidase
MKIAVVAPSCTLKPAAAEMVVAIATARGDAKVAVHPQCFRSAGHFAGTDVERLAALREAMADPEVDAIWFARGGYGANRIAQEAVRDLPACAKSKLFMGYSDAGFLLAALHAAGAPVAWGPMPQDALRPGGEAAIHRALDWLVRREASALEPGLKGPAMAFNLAVLASLTGTGLEPDLSGCELLIEEVGEYDYRVDRMMFQITSSPSVRRCTRLRLGRVSDTLPNEPDFGSDTAAIVADWCARSGIPFGGAADIGHDASNKVVPFGLRG